MMVIAGRFGILLFDDTGRVTDRFDLAEDAVRAVELIKPSLAIPFHYNTWPSVAADPWEFKRLAEGISPVTVLSPGEEIVL